MDNRCIGIFDSGVGGLTVAAEVVKAMPGERIIYFGDTARVPYGSKPRETVTEYGRQIINFLISKDVKLIIIACGTISSNSYEILTQEFDIPMIEVVTPGIEAAIDSLERINGRTIGVIGTETTIKSGIYEQRLRDRCPDIIVRQKACPLFVPLAEEGWIDNEISRLAAKTYIDDSYADGLDALLLACTHYPLMIDSIKHAAGSAIIVNPAEKTAFRAKSFLESQNLMCEPGDAGSHKLYVSGGIEKFAKISDMLLGKGNQIELARLE